MAYEEHPVSKGRLPYTWPTIGGMQSEARRMAAEKCWPYPWRFRVNSTHVRELAGVLDPGPCFNFGIGPNTLAGMPFVLDETIRRARLETYRAG